MSDTEQRLKVSDDDVEPSDRNLLQGKEDNDPYFDDLDHGTAWVVLAGSFGTFCLMGATQFASGIVHMILLDRYQASVTATSVAGAIHMSVISIGAPVSTFVLERYSCRVAIVASGCLFFLGYFGTAFAPNIEFVVFTYGIIAGIGGALGYTASMVVVTYHFKRKRNIAMGIAIAGAGVGISLLALLMDYIYNQYGSFGFFLLMSGIFAHNIVFGMLSFPSKLEIYTKLQRTSHHLKGYKTKLSNVLRSYLIVLKNKAILCLCFGMFNFCVGTYLVYLHLPHYVKEKGFPQSVAANLVSLSGILTVAGRILTGSIANFRFVRDDILYCLPMFILGIMTIVYPYISNTFPGNLTFVIFLGLFYGNVYVLTASVSVNHVGIVNVAKAIGLQYFFAGIGGLVGPILAGILVDTGGTYDDALYTAGACLLLAGITSAAATFVSKSGNSNLDYNDKTKEIICEQHSLDQTSEKENDKERIKGANMTQVQEAKLL